MSLINDVQIVLIEKSSDDAVLTKRSLERAHFTNEIIWLPDGKEAINYLQCDGKYAGRHTTTKPKLILLDLKLPKLNRVEVLERIKTDDNLKRIPLVVMTSSK